MLSLLLWRKRSNLSLPGGDGDAVQNQVARRGAQVEMARRVQPVIQEVEARKQWSSSAQGELADQTDG